MDTRKYPRVRTNTHKYAQYAQYAQIRTIRTNTHIVRTDTQIDTHKYARVRTSAQTYKWRYWRIEPFTDVITEQRIVDRHDVSSPAHPSPLELFMHSLRHCKYWIYQIHTCLNIGITGGGCAYFIYSFAGSEALFLHMYLGSEDGADGDAPAHLWGAEYNSIFDSNTRGSNYDPDY